MVQYGLIYKILEQGHIGGSKTETSAFSAAKNHSPPLLA